MVGVAEIAVVVVSWKPTIVALLGVISSCTRFDPEPVPETTVVVLIIVGGSTAVVAGVTKETISP
jgi:hypothetical protein